MKLIKAITFELLRLAQYVAYYGGLLFILSYGSIAALGHFAVWADLGVWYLLPHLVMPFIYIYNKTYPENVLFFAIREGRGVES